MHKMIERQQIILTLLMLAMLFLLVFSSCDMSLAPEGMLSVTMVEPSNEKSLNIEPDGVDLVVQTYTITLTKADGTIVTTTKNKGSDTSFVIEGLTVGSWSMRVAGKNSAGRIVAELEGGPLSVGVQRGKVSEVSARIVPCSGNGTLSISVAIEGTYDQINDPYVRVKVLDENGDSQIMRTYPVPFNGMVVPDISLPAGWYRIQIFLMDYTTIMDTQNFYPHIVEGKVTSHSIRFDVGSYNIGDIGPAGGLVFHAFSDSEELDAAGTNNATIHGPIRSTIDGYSGMKFFDSGSYLELSQDLAIIPNVFEAKVYVYSDHLATDRVGIIAGNFDGTTGANNTHTMGWEVYTNGNPRIWWDGGTRDIVYNYDVRKDQWIHLKWVRDESAGSIRLFVDDGDADGKGSDVFEVTTWIRNTSSNGAPGAGADVSLDATGRKLRIGSDYPNIRQAFKGYIADVKIHDDQEQLKLYYPMKRYLEAAPDDLRVLGDGTATCDSSLPGYGTATSQFPFGSYGATETYQNLGAGRLSTENLVASGGATDEYAPRLASVLVHNGYDDWFLPSKAEMEEMVTVLHNQYNPLSTFQEDSLYWTSTQFNDTAAYIQKFSPSYVPATFVSNNTALHVRPARFL
ncbi:hypothetical protein [uncultured Sphaerochaeta sp.]|uniref:hypothetical protein n=1 Tax=uncultured Sphaerochaeta sp. TaxID=886478 RepID=UPI0029CA5DDC|nr:hypothetical protein [uncultured Sphaerochaeta sp.]